LGRNGDEVIRALGAFGGGLGGNGGVCGALVGGLATIGLRFSRGREEEKEDPRMWTYAHELFDRFRDEIVKEHGGISCQEIVHVDWRDRDQVKSFYSGDKRLECRRIVGEAAKLVGDLLERT
jgi:C_GCAxxG_C_C family probable redox protein